LNMYKIHEHPARLSITRQEKFERPMNLARPFGVTKLVSSLIERIYGDLMQPATL
jgi:hypothetical protein